MAKRKDTVPSDTMDDSDCELSMNQKKFKGASTYKTKYNKEWEKTYPFIRPVHDDPHSFRCSVCMKNLSCAHQGIADVKSHSKAASHQKISKNMASQPKLSFSTSDPLTDKVTMLIAFCLSSKFIFCIVGNSC